MSLERDEPSPRIIDAVFSAERSPRRALVLLSLCTALLLHAALFVFGSFSKQSLESWSAELAVRVHAELSREELVTIAKPPPPPPPPPPEVEGPPPEARAEKPVAAPSERRNAAPPAQAAAIIARESDPNAPVDLTGESFVTGSANAYAGGVTSTRGTSTHAVRDLAPAPTAARNEARASGPDRSRPVSFDNEAWNCSWPSDADATDIDEQRVVLRVVVGADGRAESARIEQDPGHGFGQAATRCALQTRFTEARDRGGRPIKATSPPIRVLFTR